MMDGAKIKVVVLSPVRPGSSQTQRLEDEYVCQKFHRILPAGPTASGGYREHTIIQFWARHGGMRTVRADNIVAIR